MNKNFADRMGSVHRSFIREILKVTGDPSIISFAGGLPNPNMFPVAEMAEAARSVLSENGPSALQYSTTEGDPELRRIISERYRNMKGLDVDPDSILMATGSQQCLDLIGKVFLNKGDKVLIERPGYLGAIQAFSIFEPEFVTIPLEDDGPDLEAMEKALDENDIKLFYSVPNFQNPSGVTYSEEKRKGVAELLKSRNVLMVEDDPYGELRFMGEDKTPMYKLLGDGCLLLGTFSKIAAPGFRLGWIVAPKEIRDKLVIAKQAADLHTSTVSQSIMVRYMKDNDIEQHIGRIRDCYGKHRELMVESMLRHLPEEVRFTRPEGGMFLWAELPEECSSMELFDKAIERKVAFVPGRPFYVDGSGENTLRLNFSNADPDGLDEGIRRLGKCLEEYVNA